MEWDVAMGTWFSWNKQKLIGFFFFIILKRNFTKILKGLKKEEQLSVISSLSGDFQLKIESKGILIILNYIKLIFTFFKCHICLYQWLLSCDCCFYIYFLPKTRIQKIEWLHIYAPVDMQWSLGQFYLISSFKIRVPSTNWTAQCHCAC